MLTLRRARGRGRGGRDRHRRRRVHRHAGSPAWESGSTPSSSARRWPTSIPSKAATTCSRSTWRWTRSRATQIASWERGYGDFALDAGPGHVAADPVARGDRARPLRRPLARRNAGSAVAAPGAEGADGAGSGARPHADDGLGARVLPPARDLPGGVGAAVRGPDAVRAVHPRLPHPRHDLRRGPHPPDPQRHARRGHQGRDLEGRGVAGPARDQLPLRRRADDGRQPRRSTRTARRRSRT